jgi:hypothetical protein
MRSTKIHLTSSEAATRLGVTARRARALAASGRIEGAVKIGRDWIIPASARIAAGTRGPSLRATVGAIDVVVVPQGKAQTLKRARQRRFRKRAARSAPLARSAVAFNLPRDSVRFKEPELSSEDLT